MLAGLTGAGGVLAAGIWIAVERRRRRQHRTRRPGRVIGISAERATTEVERTVRAVGSVTVATVGWMDEVLHRTAAAHTAAGLAVPRLAAVGLGGDLVVRWVDPADPVGPWTGTPQEWHLDPKVPLEQVGPHLPDQPAPYPALVTTGTGPDGTIWLINLEDQVTVLIGDPDAGRDLARYWAAEIACNAWSGQVHLDCVGLATEVAAMNPDRVHAHPTLPSAHAVDPGDPLTQVLAEAVATVHRSRQVRQDVVTARITGAGDDAWPSRIVLLEDPQTSNRHRPCPHPACGGRPDRHARFPFGSDVRRGGGLRWDVPRVGGRDRLAGRRACRTRLRDRAGRWDRPDPGRLDRAGSPRRRGPARRRRQRRGRRPPSPRRRQHRAPPTSPDPEAPLAQTSWRTWAGQDGSVRVEHTQARPRTTPLDPAALPLVDGPRLVPDAGRQHPTEPARQASTAGTGASPEIPVEAAIPTSEGQAAQSLLPASDEEYLAVAATTREDLQALAPQVAAPVAAAISRADPGLDVDLAAWHSPDCPLPRLTLLGPVGARTRGKAVTKRKPYWTEVLAFLALRRHGATPAELADAFGLTNAKAREYVRIVRDWLGTNPRTGTLHLPHAQDAPSAITRGIGVYEVADVLVDVDLFRRLRLRAQARGPEGIEDLVAALRLVQGRPFDRLREGGWSWLTDGDRLDHHMVSAVVDVAHLVTAHALQVGDLSLARWATEAAVLAAPYEEIPKLDLAAIAQAEGRPERAASILRDEVTDRCDSDDGAPDDLPARSSEILAVTNWPPRQAYRREPVSDLGQVNRSPDPAPYESGGSASRRDRVVAVFPPPAKPSSMRQGGACNGDAVFPGDLAHATSAVLRTLICP